jgi:UDP-glucose 4-epimerase
MKALVTGISGAMGRMVARRLLEAGYEVIGIDRRPWPDAPRGVEMIRADIRKRDAEDVFRTRKPTAVIHMATVTHFTASFEERYRINLNGTRSIFDHCHTYGVENIVFVGRATVYGAAPDSALYHTEDDPPLAASTFPELSDLVAADLYAGSSLWRWPEITTTVLRMVYTLGPSRYGTLANFLGNQRVPMVWGFDPLYQFMHEEDAARAVVAALQKNIKGVFNVAGPAPVPLSILCKATDKKAAHIPEILFESVIGRFGLAKLPPGAVNHVKYPVVVDGSMFQKVTGFTHEYDEVQTMEAFRWA